MTSLTNLVVREHLQRSFSVSSHDTILAERFDELSAHQNLIEIEGREFLFNFEWAPESRYDVDAWRMGGPANPKTIEHLIDEIYWT